MSYQMIFREVMREYDRLQLAGEKRRRARLAEAYTVEPRILELEKEINRLGAQASRAAIGKSKGERQAVYAVFGEESQALQGEMNRLLAEIGFDPAYLADVYRCGLCKDTGFVEGKKCSCLLQRLIGKYYEISNIRHQLEKENFDTFDMRFYSQEINEREGISPYGNMETVARVCMAFVKGFENNGGNLLFYGPPGLGKTFLCNCIAKDILDRGKTVLYVTAPQLFKMMEEYRFHREDMEDREGYVQMVEWADLLIIDDLGTEMATGFTLSEFFNLVNGRLLNQKPVIISTNLSPYQDFGNVYSERIVSRLLGDYVLLKFFGEDIRQKKKYAWQ